MICVSSQFIIIIISKLFNNGKAEAASRGRFKNYLQINLLNYKLI